MPAGDQGVGAAKPAPRTGPRVRRGIAPTLLLDAVLAERPDELDADQVHRQVDQLLAPLSPAVGAYLDERGLRRTDPALLLRLMMLQIGSTAAFLPGTYPHPRQTDPAPAVPRGVHRHLDSRPSVIPRHCRPWPSPAQRPAKGATTVPARRPSPISVQVTRTPSSARACDTWGTSL